MGIRSTGVRRSIPSLATTLPASHIQGSLGKSVTLRGVQEEDAAGRGPEVPWRRRARSRARADGSGRGAGRQARAASSGG